MINIESLVSDSILNEPIEITVGSVKMKINKPTVSTLISASKYIGKLPNIPNPETKSDEIEIVLGYARDCSVIGEIAAILFLGHKNMFTEKKLFGLTYKFVDNVKPLAAKILDEYSSKDLYNLITALLSEQDIAFFLNITISLNRANLLRKTKMNETIASGL